MISRMTLMVTAAIMLNACNAYRTQPESEVLYTRQELTKKGFVLAPIVDLDAKGQAGPSDLLTYDAILANTLRETWKHTTVFSAAEIAALVEPRPVEAWRVKLSKEDQKAVSQSTRSVLSGLTNLGKTYPPQILLPSILSNLVSCGRKEALATYLNPKAKGMRMYCQRTLKMRFRIMSTEASDLLWNGIIYATQETVGPNGATADDAPIEAPLTQSLIRESFHNFAKQFADK